MIRTVTSDEMVATEAAVTAGGVALVGHFAGQACEAVLQTAGDAVLHAVRAGTTGAASLGRRWVYALGERGWPGDAELGAQFAAATGVGPVPLLRAICVDLADVAAVLEDEAADGVVFDLSTGTWTHVLDEEVAEAEDRWLHLVPFGARERRLDAREFERSFGGPPSREPAAFAWFVRERSRGRARAALAEAGFRPG